MGKKSAEEPRRRRTIHRGILDRVIETFAPTWAVARYEARFRILAADHFYGAGTGRKSMEFWKPTDADADETNLNNLPDLRTRSRDLERNNPLASGALKNALTYEVGYGWMRHDDAMRREAEAICKHFVRDCGFHEQKESVWSAMMRRAGLVR